MVYIYKHMCGEYCDYIPTMTVLSILSSATIAWYTRVFGLQRIFCATDHGSSIPDHLVKIYRGVCPLILNQWVWSQSISNNR